MRKDAIPVNPKLDQFKSCRDLGDAQLDYNDEVLTTLPHIRFYGLAVSNRAIQFLAYVYTL